MKFRNISDTKTKELLCTFCLSSFIYFSASVPVGTGFAQLHPVTTWMKTHLTYVRLIQAQYISNYLIPRTGN